MAATSGRGFTLIELMVALGIAALLAGMATPMAVKMYATMQYRDAIRNMTGAATTARYQAINTGKAHDLLVAPDAHRYAVQLAESRFDPERAAEIPDALSIAMEVSQSLVTERGVGVIRFYPDGTSTGGSITLTRASGDGQRIRVDWLLGRVTHEPPESS
ncbi:MAG: GspH/FimT family pseudopilin [Haliea sp.]|uniref:GspH/FimT family pseudopilin n=1 Tax=Haliea sp. TaxID=1932666 RepID=UPI0032F089F5